MSDYKLKRRVFLFQRLMNWIERFTQDILTAGTPHLFRKGPPTREQEMQGFLPL